MAYATNPTPRAFTLIELLVVIAVIGLLVGIALPALGKARKSGERVREMAAIRQTGTAYTVYAQDNRGKLLPGFLPLEWVTPGMAPGREFKVFTNDTGAGGAPITGSNARRYPWRLAPYLNYSREALVVDRNLRSEYNALPDDPDVRTGFQWAIAQGPSFGLNTTYVGGDARRGGFHQPSLARWGKYYATTIDEPKYTDKLLIFATSRGNHPITDGRVVPGRHRIEGPWRATSIIAQVPTFSPWGAATGGFDPSRSPESYGYVDFRHGNRALTVMFDGHAAAHTLDDLRDMTRWSNQANAPGWRPQ